MQAYSACLRWNGEFNQNVLHVEYRTLGHLFGIGRSTACDITREVICAVNEVLLPRYLTFPKGRAMEKVISGFRENWNLPQCAGAIDGSHIPIIGPQENHTDFYNRKSHFSIIIQAVVDHDYKFIDIYVGCPGKMHDARVFRQSKLYENGQTGSLLPDKTELITDTEVPVFIVGDPAYPLLPWLMKAYPGKNLPKEKRYFNYRLSRARMVVEGAFGRLKGRWRCLLKRYDTSLEFVPNTVTACCVLHNICQVHNEYFDQAWQVDANEDNQICTQQQELDQEINIDEVDINRAKAIRNALCQWVKVNDE